MPTDVVEGRINVADVRCLLRLGTTILSVHRSSQVSVQRLKHKRRRNSKLAVRGASRTQADEVRTSMHHPSTEGLHHLSK